MGAIVEKNYGRTENVQSNVVQKELDPAGKKLGIGEAEKSRGTAPGRDITEVRIQLMEAFGA